MLLTSGLLCWLARDIEENVALPEPLPENICGLAEDFADRHLLHHDASLFGADCQPTRDDLRTIFEEVRRYHPPVDTDTEDIIEVIENYLYAGKKLENSGADQHDHVLFGSEFFDVWEMLCLHHAYKKEIKNGCKVLIADGGNLPDWLCNEDAFKNRLVHADAVNSEHSIYQDETGLGLVFNHKRPDLILYSKENGTITYRIIDFKYYQWADLRPHPDPKQLNDSEKKFFLGTETDGNFNLTKGDIAKSWGYAQSVLCWHNKNMLGKKIIIKLEFWLPSDLNLPEQIYSAGELHAKPLSLMIDELLKDSPSPWLEH